MVFFFLLFFPVANLFLFAHFNTSPYSFIEADLIFRIEVSEMCASSAGNVSLRDTMVFDN